MHIDPGHGGEDPGACANGLVEAQLTGAMAHAVHEELSARGFSVSIGPQATPSGEKYPNRLRPAGANARGAVHLCLHYNAGGGRYGMVLFRRDNPQSARLAQGVAARMGALFGDLVTDVRVRMLEDGERGAALLEGVERSAVLLEPLFLDRRQHAAWLGVQANRRALAVAVAQAVEDLAASTGGYPRQTGLRQAAAGSGEE